MDAILIHYGYIALFPFSFVELRITTISAGFLISIGYFDFWVAFPIILLSSISCDNLLYWLGRKTAISSKLISYIDRSSFLSANFKTIEKFRIKYPIKTMFIGKNAFMIGVAVVFSAGMAKMPYTYFLLYNIVACFLQVVVLLAIGYYLGDGYIIAAKYMEYPSIVVTVLIVLIWFIYYKFSKKIVKYFQK